MSLVVSPAGADSGSAATGGCQQIATVALVLATGLFIQLATLVFPSSLASSPPVSVWAGFRSAFQTADE